MQKKKPRHGEECLVPLLEDSFLLGILRNLFPVLQMACLSPVSPMNSLPTGHLLPQADKPNIERTSPRPFSPPCPPDGNLPVLASPFSSLLG